MGSGQALLEKLVAPTVVQVEQAATGAGPAHSACGRGGGGGGIYLCFIFLGGGCTDVQVLCRAPAAAAQQRRHAARGHRERRSPAPPLTSTAPLVLNVVGMWGMMPGWRHGTARAGASRVSRRVGGRDVRLVGKRRGGGKRAAVRASGPHLLALGHHARVGAQRGVSLVERAGVRGAAPARAARQTRRGSVRACARRPGRATPSLRGGRGRGRGCGAAAASPRSPASWTCHRHRMRCPLRFLGGGNTVHLHVRMILLGHSEAKGRDAKPCEPAWAHPARAGCSRCRRQPRRCPTGSPCPAALCTPPRCGR